MGSRLTVCMIMIVFAQACSMYKPASKTDVSMAYNPLKKKLHPKVAIYHTAEDSSQITFRQDRNELMYESERSARVQFKYEILTGYASKTIIDSHSVIIYDSLQQKTKNTIEFSHTFYLPSGENYLIRAGVKDRNSHFTAWSFHSVKKENSYQRGFFRMLDMHDKAVFSPLINEKDSFRIQYEHAPALTVSYFKEQFKPARPPYLNNRKRELEMEADSTFPITLSDGRSEPLQFSQPGIYHIQADTSQKDGLTLFYFSNDYPKVTSAKQMIPPVRYIATRNEYSNLLESEHPRTDIEDFWLKLTNNPERSRILIRNYYNRVEQANKLFFTHKPGWKTDRGMVYIVLGPPQMVYKSNDKETWIYGESARYNAIKMDFIKADNPFTENDYILERSPLYKDEWFFSINYQRR
ncbi:MAG: GWxTD domain-containing protein [Bacteroidales bacterium]